MGWLSNAVKKVGGAFKATVKLVAYPSRIASRLTKGYVPDFSTAKGRKAGAKSMAGVGLLMTGNPSGLGLVAAGSMESRGVAVMEKARGRAKRAVRLERRRGAGYDAEGVGASGVSSGGVGGAGLALAAAAGVGAALLWSSR